MKRIGSGLLMAAAALFFMSCAAKITQQPGVEIVKKIAIISVYSNSTPYNLEGKGGALAAISSVASKKEGKEGFGGTRLAEYALEMYTTDMKKISGWEIVPPEEVVNAPAYVAFCDTIKARRGSIIGAISKVALVTPPGMIIYDLSGAVPKKRIEEATSLCNDLGVDAVATIEIDIAYEKKGLLSAIASVAASINAINSNGEWALRSPEAQSVGTKSRFVSDSKTAMVAGEIIFSEKVEMMFEDAIQQNVMHHVQKIREELR
jgi:hypothetical protein